VVFVFDAPVWRIEQVRDSLKFLFRGLFPEILLFPPPGNWKWVECAAGWLRC